MKSGFPNHLRKAGFRSGVKETADCPRSSSEADARWRGGAHKPHGTWEQVCIPVMQSVRQFLPLELLTSFPPPWLLSPRTVILLLLGQRWPGTLLLRQAAPWPISTYRAVGRGLWPALGNPRAPHTEDHPDRGLTTTSADGRKHRFAMNGSVGQRQAGGTEAA